MSDEFYLHEDEWGMVELLPRENYAERQKVVAEATAHSDAHRAPGGVGWTAIYVAPEAKVPISARGITLAALAEALGPGWTRCARVTSGYSTYVEEATSSYAFRPPERHHNWNVIYGVFRGELVTSLCVTHCELPITPVLHRLGTTYQLMLCDLWKDEVVDLADPVALARYIQADSDDE
jgi:hypothetical protein